MVVTGIIRPPPEIRAVADRTALYVAKNGRAFEQRILNSAKGQTPKFAFLHANSPFHAYYEDRIQHYEANGGVEDDKKEEKKTEKTKKEKETPKTEELPKSSTLKASAIDPVAKALLTQRNKIIVIQNSQEDAAKKQDGNEPVLPVHIPSPRALSFVDIVPPASASIAQLEEIQLVAQLVALAPTHLQLLQHITHREWNNPAFGFCQPRHGHFAYFSALVDAYRTILSQWKNEQQQQPSNHLIQEMANNVPKCLEVAAYRAEYERHKNQQSSESTDNVATIDWHDFVVVETIDFPVDEVVSMLPPPPPPPPVPSSLPVAGTEDRMNQSDDEEEGEDEPIRVVPSYKPKVVAAGTDLMETVIDPITGKKVNIKDLPEHMRIQLLDPKWAEERKKFQDKQKETNLVTGDVVASNLERFAQARGDRFGKKEQDLLSQEAESKKRLEEANRIIREQAQSTVGPTLPVQRKEAPTGIESEPASKRPKITYAPSIAQPTVLPPPPPPITEQMLPPPQPPLATEGEDSFMASAAGAINVPTESSAMAGTAELIPEEEFAASLSKPEVTLQIRIPNDPSQMAWNFYGQIVSLSTHVMSKVKTIKEQLSNTHLNGIPANKIQLKNVANGAFLKDANSLASLNLGPNITLELVPRARGGKKK